MKQEPVILNPTASIYSITHASLLKSEGKGANLTLDGIKIIIEAVCKVFNLNVRDLTGKCRRAEYIAPRHLAMYMCRKKTTATLLQIGKAFNRDHTTVIHANQSVEGYLKIQDDVFMAYWEMWNANAPKYLLT